MPRRTIPLVTRRKVRRALRRQSGSYTAIAKRYGVGRTTVYTWAVAAGLNYHHPDHLLRTRIIELATRGAITTQEIARQLRCSLTYVRQVCLEYDLLCECHPVTGEWYFPKRIHDVTVWPELKPYEELAAAWHAGTLTDPLVMEMER